MPRPPVALSPSQPITSPWNIIVRQPPEKRQRCTSLSLSKTSHSSISSTCSTISWTVGDIAKAACLLSIPPLPTGFTDEHEMRRVYSLIYDVFRYKNVLNQILTDMHFYYVYPELSPCYHLVWLLIYDMYSRKFREREPFDMVQCQEYFPKCNLTHVESCLWKCRIRLAASISRLRIANNALRLTDMLPLHLRDERVTRAAQETPVTAWVNKYKVRSPLDIILNLQMAMRLKLVDNKEIGEDDFRWDSVCPMFLCFHHSLRMALAQSPFVYDNTLIIQDRSFCYGPAMFSKVLSDMKLSGSVVLTHVNSPRATAYLAALLSQNEQIYSLLAFGAGDRKAEFEEYMQKLKVENIMIFSKRVTEMEPDADILEQVVAVFATPPNSYSAVRDPVDLVCGRGGDLFMLEVLTDTEDSVEGKKRVARILEEQRLTLRFAMSKPQVQIVMYETHSQLVSENDDMVKQVLSEMNMTAKYKHAEQEGRFAVIPSYMQTGKRESLIEREINNNDSNIKNATKVKDEPMKVKYVDSDESCTTDDEEFYKDIELPEIDEFEQTKLPDLCLKGDSCLKLKEEGCYLALLKRKEIIHLDSKYMIKMAEARGLFGDTTTDPAPKKPVKSAKLRKDSPPSQKFKKRTIEIERISAHTHASYMRTFEMRNTDPSKCKEEPRMCPRNRSLEQNKSSNPARLWWTETTRYLTRLKRSLVRQKIISNKPSILRALQPDKVLTDINNIDEILTRVRQTDQTNGAKIPVFPKLRLSRSPVRLKRIPFPLYNCSVELPERRYY